MTSPVPKKPCIRCVKGKGVLTCVGCNHWFCTKHLFEHRQDLAIQIELIGQEHDLLQRELSEDIKSHPLLQTINEWEQKFVETIQTMANDARQKLEKSIAENKTHLKASLREIMTDVEASRNLNDYTEIELNQWNERLKQIREYFEQQVTIDIIQNDQAQLIINPIQVTTNIITDQTRTPTQEISMRITPRSNISIGVDDKWVQNGKTLAGGFGPGSKPYELYGPRGIYVDDDMNLFIADSDNHRIVEWKYFSTYGLVIAGEHGRGNRSNLLDNPVDLVFHSDTNSFIVCDRTNRRIMQWSRKNPAHGTTIIANLSCQGLALDNQGLLYISDAANHEVRRYRVGEATGTIVAGGNGKGHRLDQLNHPTCLFVDTEQSIYVSDSNNNRMVKWVKDAMEGVIVAGGEGNGNSLSQLSNPRGVAVDALGRVYVVDGWNHRIVRWTEGMTQGELIVGGNGQGKQANQLSFPEHLTFDRDGNLYVADCLNHRIQCFKIRKN